jgi:hypothetical protein
MMIIQRIKVEWTKASRGATGARRRNKIAEAFRLPEETEPIQDIVFHDLGFDEKKEFCCHVGPDILAANEQLKIAPLHVRLSRGLLELRFVWTKEACGAPERNSHDLFRLKIDQWGRFVCNGRFSKDWDISEWTYHKTVFNVAHVAEYDRDLFLSTTPNAATQRLSKLL